MEGYVLALDIGGSKLMAALMDSRGKIYDSSRLEWAVKSEKELIEKIVGAGRRLLDIHRDLEVTALGVTIPGLADPLRGLWVEAVFSGLGNIKIRELLEEEFRLPVFIDNDGQACALAEKVFGRCKAQKDFLYVTVSNGVGGGLFVNNTLYYGGWGHAGEIGHFVVKEEGRRCNCGSRGCLEMYASGPGLVKNYLELGGDSSLRDARKIALLARRGDKLALQSFELEGYYLGKAIGSVANLINPEKVVLGGGVSQSFDLFKDSLMRSAESFMYKKANKVLVIEASDFGQDGGLYGACALAVCGPKKDFGWGG